MSLNATPNGERLHIGFFGRRNAGKSSVVNAVTGQALAIVSDVLGTTTDPVLKAMELLPLGPVVIIDTPGIDDEGELGTLRVKRSYQMLNKTDVAVLVVDSTLGLTAEDQQLLDRIRLKQIPYLVVYNKCDQTHTPPPDGEHTVCVSAVTGEGIHALKEAIAHCAQPHENTKRLVSFLLAPEDIVVLVVPIDSAAPKGRLILPQQQTIRDILDTHAVCLVTQPKELPHTLRALAKKPKLVITDSQAFAAVSKMVPEDIPLTSFSILFAHYKGNLSQAVQGAAALDTLTDSDTILMAEGCTHHRQCDDIGTVKIPNLIRRYTGKNPQFVWTSGTEFPEDLHPYRLIIHCGGCMLNEREMKYRLKCAADDGIPITNYGTAIAHMTGILKRSIAALSSRTDSSTGNRSAGESL